MIVFAEVTVEEVRALAEPVPGIVQFIVVVRPPLVDESSVVGVLGLDLVVHRIPRLADALQIEEVAHKDSAVVYQLPAEVFVLHQLSEQQGVLLVVGSPTVVTVVTGIVDPVQYPVVVWVAIESHGIVHVLGYPSPATALGPGPPHDDVIAGEVVVVEIQVHHHQVDELLTVHPLLVFLHRVPVFCVEGLEVIVVIPLALLQVPPVLNQVYVLQSVIVGVYIILVGPFPDIQHAFILPVDINDGWPPGLPVQIYMLCHDALADGIAHIEIVEVVAGIPQHDRLEVRQSRLLVWEEFVVEALGAEPFVGIEGQRLKLCAS